jgi:hypothetical protein
VHAPALLKTEAPNDGQDGEGKDDDPQDLASGNRHNRVDGAGELFEQSKQSSDRDSRHGGRREHRKPAEPRR